MYDEQLIAARKRILEAVTKEQGPEKAKQVKTAMEVEDTLTVALRQLIKKGMEQAEHNPEALMLVKLAVAEATSTVYAECAAEAFCSSKERKGSNETEMEMVSLAIRSVAGNLQVAFTNRQMAKEGIEDMIASARA